MANASNIPQGTNHRILVLGDTGSGKTTQFLTLPGKKFAYLFDPNAILSLQGHDIEYEEFLPDQINLGITSLKKDNRAGVGNAVSDLYVRWEADFNSKMQSGFFDQYDWIAMDSATTLLDLIMDRVLTINGRFGQWPQLDDYGPQMLAFTNICRSITGLQKGIYMTGHLDTREDKVTQRIFRRPLMTGRLQTKIPLLFSDILITEAENDGSGKVVYKMQTVPDRLTTCVRTSIKELEPFEIVTIDWKQPVEGQGLGGILNWERKKLTGAQTSPIT